MADIAGLCYDYDAKLESWCAMILRRWGFFIILVKNFYGSE